MSTDVAEGLHVRNVHGEVVACGVSGPVDASTSFAKLEVRKAGSDLLLRNEHGAVVVQGGGGKLDVATAHAAIEIESPAPNIRCRNEHGKIRIVSTGSTFPLIDAETSFGCELQQADVIMSKLDHRNVTSSAIIRTSVRRHACRYAVLSPQPGLGGALPECVVPP